MRQHHPASLGAVLAGLAAARWWPASVRGACRAARRRSTPVDRVTW